MWHVNHLGNGFSLFHIFVIIVVLFIIYQIFGKNRKTDNNYSHKSIESALDVLKKRYAKGEIDKVEFEQMKKDIS
jgi:putative membrane protein